MSANDKQLNSDTSLLDKAQTLLTEITQAEYDKDTVRHFVLHHTSRATSFSNAVNFILTSKSIDSAKYLMDLVCKNFNKVSRLVSAIEDDGAVTLNDDVWGFIDLEEDANATLKAHLVKLIDTTKRAEDNPNLDVDTSNANVGVVRLSYDNNNLYAVQRTTDVGKTAIDSKVGSWYRGSKNEAYIVDDVRYRIEPDYDFFILNKNGEYFLFIRNFKSFEHTANFNEAQDRHAKKGLEKLAEDQFITTRELEKLSNAVSSMGVREKSHLIKSIAAEQYKNWTSLKNQQDIANKSLPKDKQWSMIFNDKDEFVYNGTPESLSQFVKFISHTIVKSASDENYIRDITNWVEG